MAERVQTFNEEIANTITHGLGILFTLIAIPCLVSYALKSSSREIIWGIWVFGFGMLMVYMSSTFYHAVQKQPTKRLLRIWDHISIFLMIAGSYTPLVIKYTNPSTATPFLIVMWLLVAIGCILKIFFTGKYMIFSVIIYIALGWMAIFIIRPLIANVPAPIFAWILASGAAYMFGVIFYLWKRLKYHHAVWHVFVLAGTVTHFFAVYNSIPVLVHLQ